jgi:serine/threonine protein kinase
METTAALGPRRRYGRYAIAQSLGEGAMGDVFRARDTVLGRDVALKVMKAFGPDQETFRARFEAEARALARLAHPSAVQVFDVGWEGDEPYLVMELVGGGTLRGHLEAGPLRPDEVRSLGIQIGNALAAAHDHGILHRDVKPANILGDPGRWKLADFGIAHMPGSELTVTGQFLGTPAYAAPESLAAGAFSPASDVYGLGATLYAALTGQPPYGGHLGALTTTPLAPIEARAPATPPALIAAVTAALDRDPAGRPTARDLVDQLARDPAGVSPTHANARTASAAGVSPTHVNARTASAAAAAPPSSPPPPRVSHTHGRAWIDEATGQPVAAASPPPHVSRTHASTRWIKAGLGAAALALVVGLVAHGAGSERASGARPAAAGELPAADIVLPAQAYPRPGKLEKKWRDALRKVERGDLDGAVEKAAQILREDPGDVQARALHDELVRRGARPHDHDDRDD